MKSINRGITKELRRGEKSCNDRFIYPYDRILYQICLSYSRVMRLLLKNLCPIVMALQCHANGYACAMQVAFQCHANGYTCAMQVAPG
ncbi:MAG: hypothetical protein LUH15_14940 [Tannerellaceae bacterium]|nr:hypothetical protein [Tannerellaceae bacterium]